MKMTHDERLLECTPSIHSSRGLAEKFTSHALSHLSLAKLGPALLMLCSTRAYAGYLPRRLKISCKIFSRSLKKEVNE